MPIDFPNTPTTNDEFVAAGRTWVYDGSKWAAKTVAFTHAATHAAAGTDPVQISQSQVSGLGVDLAAKASLTGAESLTNKSLITPVISQGVREPALVSGGLSGAYSFYTATNGAVQMLLGAYTSANGIVNIRASASATLDSVMAVNETMTVTLVVTNSTTAYYVTGVQVDGATPAGGVRWQGGTAPSSGNANSYDVYTFVILKYASASFNVLASQTKFA